MTPIQEVVVIGRDDTQKRTLRLIASRLPTEAANRARQRVRKAARRKGRTPKDETLLAAGFCMVITTLPQKHWSAQEVLLLYRCRWQIEWTFRRWKSIVQLKVLPSYPSNLAEVVLQAKLLLIWWLHRRILPGWLPWRLGQTDTVQPPLLSLLIHFSYEMLVAVI